MFTVPYDGNRRNTIVILPYGDTRVLETSFGEYLGLMQVKRHRKGCGGCRSVLTRLTFPLYVGENCYFDPYEQSLDPPLMYGNHRKYLDAPSLIRLEKRSTNLSYIWKFVLAGIPESPQGSFFRSLRNREYPRIIIITVMLLEKGPLHPSRFMETNNRNEQWRGH